MSYDAIVAGGGHNGLVCAAHLARGRPPRRRRRAPRAQSAASSTASCSTVGRLRPGVVAELELERHGLELRAPGRPHAGAARRRPAAHVLGRSGAHGRGARRASRPRTRSAYPRFDAHVRRARPLPGRAGRGHAAAARLGRDRRLAGRPAARPRLPAPERPRRPRADPGAADGRGRLRRRVVRVATRCAAPLAARGSLFTAMGPWSAGTALVLLADSAGNDGGAAGQTTFAKGGPAALARGARGRGGRGRRRGAHRRGGVDAARPRRRGSPGVALASGEEIEAPVGGLRRRSEDGAHAVARPRGGRPAASMARREHPHAGRDRRRRAAPARAPPSSPASMPPSGCAGGSSSRPASTTSSGPSTAGSTAR